MDLTTDYLGFKLPHPFMPGASPLVNDLDMVKRLEDAGASAIVMNSLFEEQIVGEQMSAYDHLESSAESHSEAASFFPSTAEIFSLGPDAYLEQIGRIKKAVSVPVIASLNGYTPGGWIDYARLMEQAGADALELNVYHLETDPTVTAADVENRTVALVETVRKSVRIPLAIKLSPFYSSLPNFCARLEKVGVAGAVLFNRFYQADIDIDALEVKRSFHFSDSHELLLRVRWLAILSGKSKLSLAAGGGIHTTHDAIKAIMAGAHAVQTVSKLFLQGPEVIAQFRRELAHWLEEKEYTSLKQMCGSMNLTRCPDPAAYERANYAYVLQSWQKYLPGPQAN